MTKLRYIVAELCFETSETLDSLHMALNRLGFRILPARHPAERSNVELDASL
jgi:hypothetical protein